MKKETRHLGRRMLSVVNKEKQSAIILLQQESGQNVKCENKTKKQQPQNKKNNQKTKKKMLTENNKSWQVMKSLPMACGETRWQKSEANITRIMG